ncbi:hypothetical protein A3Q56_00227 [Intoshia linei]|uniref:Sodium-coupled monocarboxylate transporter 2 n=1 Tax=Intoshia linei TaxID=1819745 RepID=A0A177BE77_9BILA|nr:hypothetical protein A3Q56_00227 [Intoshia linei]
MPIDPKGGLTGLVWTDFVQFLIIIIGLIIIVVEGCRKVGTVEDIWNISKANNKLIPFNFSLNPTQRVSIYGVIFGNFFFAIGIFGTGPVTFQRFKGFKSLKLARSSLMLNIPLMFFYAILLTFLSMVVYAYFIVHRIDPIKQKLVVRDEEILPYFIIHILNIPAFSGLITSILLMLTVSTVNSVLYAMSCITYKDLLESTNLFQKHKEFTLKSAIVIYGIIIYAFSLSLNYVSYNVMKLSTMLSGATLGPSLGVFLLGMFSPYTTHKDNKF